MADFQQLMDQALSYGLPDPAPVPPPVGVSDLKKQEVSQAGAAKQAALSPTAAIPDFYQTAAGMGTARGSDSMGEVESDVRTLSPYEIIQKYGNDQGMQILTQAGHGAVAYTRDTVMKNGRGLGDRMYDTLSGVAGGTAGSFAGLGAFGVGLVDNKAGAYLGNKVQQAQQALQETQSAELNAARRAHNARTSLDFRDNTKQYQDEVASDGTFVAGLRRFTRDTVDTLASGTEDSTIFAQGTADAAGSLFAGGPLTKGLRVLGAGVLEAAGAARLVNAEGAAALATATNRARVAAAADTFNPTLLGSQGTARLTAAADWAAWPAVTAGLEGGGAYTGTASDVMNMTPDQLQQNSQPYRDLIAQNVSPEHARLEVAGLAAKQAAERQAAVGFATGGLSRWAENPLHVPSFGSAIKNTLLNEPLEESIQGATGQINQNQAVQKYGDVNRTSSEGVGEQTALGALYGISSAGVAQAPGAALHVTHQGIVDALTGAATAARGVGVAARVIGGVTGMAVNYFRGRYERTRSKTEANSPVAENVVQAASTEIRSKMGELSDLLKSVVDVSDAPTEQKDTEHAYIASLDKAMNVGQDEIQALSPRLQAVVRGADDRAKATHALGKHITSLPLGSPEQVEAIVAYGQMRAPFSALSEPNLKILNNIEQEDIRKQFNGLRGFIADVNRTPADIRANAAIAAVLGSGEELIKPSQVSDMAITTPEGQKAAEQVAIIAEMHPGAGSLETNQTVLEHANNKLVYLTPSQKAAVHASVLLLAAQKQLVDAKDMQPRDVVNNQIIREDKKDPLGNKEGNPYRLSARVHVNGILDAAKSGNMEEAGKRLHDFGLFAQHMQNKVGAFNESLNNGGHPVSFQALSPSEDRGFFKSKPYIFAALNNPTSINLSRQVGVEASVLADVYNGLTEVMPELGAKPVEKAVLDHRLQGKSAPEAKKAAPIVQKPAPAPVTQTKPEPVPVAKPEPVVSRITPEQASSLTDAGLNTRLNAIQDKQDRNSEDAATFAVLDAEMTSREDVATTEQAKEADVIVQAVAEQSPLDEEDKARGFALNSGQKLALEKVKNFLSNAAQNTFSLIGAAGTGKTTIVEEMLKNLDRKQFTGVVLSSPTHRANAVTRSKNPNSVIVTLHKLLGLKPTMDLEKFDAKDVKFGEGDAEIPPHTLIIMDESSMINDQLFDFLMLRVKQSKGTKVVFLGDSAQLNPVKQKGASKALGSTDGVAELTQVMRAKNAELLDESVAVRESGTFTYAQNMHKGNGVFFLDQANRFLDLAVKLFKSDGFKKNPLLGRVLAHSNAQVQSYNARIRNQLFPGEPNIAVGDLLMGYNAFGVADDVTGLTDIANGVDYLVDKVSEGKDTQVLSVFIPSENGKPAHTLTVTVPVQKVTIRDVFGLQDPRTIHVVAHSISPEAKANLQVALQQLARTAWRKGSTEEAQMKRFTESYALPFDMMYHNEKFNKDMTSVKKTFDFGYAHTIHKSQGGTYEYALVDDVNISASPGSAEEKGRLRYVGLTRAKHGSYVLTNREITPQKSAPGGIGLPAAAPVETKPTVVEKAPVVAEKAPVEQVTAQEAPAPVETAPATKAIAEVVAEPAADKGSTNDSGITGNSTVAERHPNLAFTGPFSLSTALQPVEGSRVVGVESPALLVAETLASQDNLEETLGGKTSRGEMTDEVVKGYATLLGENGRKNAPTLLGVMNAMKASLAKFLKDNAKDLANDPNHNQWRRGKALNIVNKNGEYDSNLLESAALAGMQFMLAGRQATRNNEDSVYHSITGIPFTSPISENLKARIDESQSLEDVKNALAQKIQKYWGLRPNPNMGKGFSEGIAQDVAAEVISALMAVGLMNIDKLTITEEMGLPSLGEGEGPNIRTIDRYVLNDDKLPENAKAYPGVIDELVLADAEPVRHMGDEIPPVADKQMNNPSIKNTPAQKRTIKRVNEQVHRMSIPMLNVFTALGKDGLSTMFAKVKPTWTVFNNDHAESLKGRMLAIENAFKEMENTFAEMSNRATKEGKPVKAMALRFAYNMSKVGRLQMLGAYNSQSSKIMREVIFSTWSTLDLVDNSSHREAFMLAIAQHLGVKVHKQSPQDSVTEVQGMLDSKYGPVLGYIDTWMNQTDLHAAPNDVLPLNADRMMELLKGEQLEVAGLHSLIEYARFQRLDEAARKNFETALYLEADGVTNGPIMAMMMMTSGAFGPTWLENVRKGGVSIGSKKSMHQLYALDKLDLYKTAAQHTNTRRGDMLVEMGKQGNKEDLFKQVHALSEVMAALFDGEATYDHATGMLTLERGITKNPLTITLYGSSAEGIAGNFADRVLDMLNEKATELASAQALDPSATIADVMFKGDTVAAARYEAALDSVFNTTLNRTNKEGFSTFPASKSRKNGQYRALRSNFLHALVEPMVLGIEDTVGKTLMKNARLLRQATQIQSIFLENAFKKEAEAMLAAKPESDRKHGLSPKELGEIDQRMSVLFPNIQTSSQVFRIAKSEKLANEDKVSRAFNDKHRTGVDFYTPTNAGVSGIASLVIGFGDGFMVQVNTTDTAMGNNGYVFDGINLPLDKLQQQGEAVNKAAYKAFLQNPMKAVDRAYRSFLTQLGNPEEVVDEKMLKDLARAFQQPGMPAPKIDDLLPKLQESMKNIAEALTNRSKEIDARHAAMEDVAMSVDHMASPASPFTNGVEATDMTDEQALAKLNERYHYHLDNPAQPVKLELVQSTEQTDGVQLYRADYLSTLAQELGLTSDQQVMMDEINSSLAAKDYVVVAGTFEQIAAYRAKHGLSMDGIDRNANGFMTPNNKRVYLINASGEVLTHELIHAATFEKILAHYRDGGSKTEVQSAVSRLEIMMGEFMKMPVDWSSSPELIQAMEDAQAAISGHQQSNSPEAKASALNEFMAWTLANKALAESLKTKQAPTFGQWAKEVVDLIKKMLWGDKKSLAVNKDFLSNIQFSTAVIMHSAPTASEMFNDATLYHSSTARGDLLTLRQRLADLIVSNIQIKAPIDQPVAVQKQTLYLSKVQELAKRAAVAFQLSSLEESTLVQVVAAMGTEVQLNSDVLARMQALYTHVQKTLEPASFMRDNPADPQVEAHWGNEKFDMIMGKNNRLIDDQGRSALLPVYLGLAAVSAEFRDVLSKIAPPGKQKGDGTFDNALRQGGDNLLQSLSSRLSGDNNSTTVKNAMDALTSKLSESLVEEKTRIDRLEATIDKANSSWNAHVVDGLTALSDKGIEVGKKLAKGNRAQRAVGNILQLTAALASEKNAEQVSQGIVATAERLDIPNALMGLLRDVIGRTDDTADVYDLIKPIRAAVQQIRQQFRDSVPQVINEAFKKAPTKEQHATMFRSMGKTDIAGLIGSMNKTDILKMYTDQNALDQKILDLEADLKKLDPKYFNLLQKKMLQLAGHMNGKGTGVNLLRNANAVANLWQENTVNRKAPTAGMISLVDQLTSLYAMDGQSTADKKAMASLVQSEPSGMNFVLSYLEGQRKTEMAKTRRDKANQNYFKGYMHSLPTKEGHVIVAEDTQYADLKQRGYTLIKKYEGSSVLNGSVSRSYYYSDLPARAAFAQGMMQNVDQTAYGIDPVTGFSTDLTAGRIVSKRLVEQLAQAQSREKAGSENLMPIFNGKGKVIAFEQSLDPRELDRLQRNDQLNQMLGVWRGRQVEERFSVQQNKLLIDTLHDTWEKERSSKADLYVNLFDPKILDAVQRDAVSLFSDEAKAYIHEKFGEGNFMVRKSMLEDVTGYRNASITDFWTNINRNETETNKAVRQAIISMMGPNAYRMLVRAEHFIQGLVSDMRTTIVVKSVIVPAYNIVSNIYQLMGRGVSPIQIAKDTPSIVTQVNSYIDSKVEQIRLEAKLRAVGDDKVMEARYRAKIRSITDSHKRLEIWPLIEAGEFSTVADVGMSHEDLKLTTGRMDSWLGSKIDKLPKELRTAAHYGLVTEDTALFRGLQKTVQYGDFVAKQILFNHLTKKMGLTKEQALTRITEEFVNYDRLPGRTRGGLENIGLLWFYNFKLRSLKVAMSMARNNPLQTLLLMGLPAPNGAGTPLDENIVSKGLAGSLSWSIGPGMATRVHTLNPWVNLLD